MLPEWGCSSCVLSFSLYICLPGRPQGIAPTMSYNGTMVPGRLAQVNAYRVRLVRSTLTNGVACVALWASHRLILVRTRGGRSLPIVAHFLHLPGLWFPILQAHIPSWVGRAAEAYLVPGVR